MMQVIGRKVAVGAAWMMAMRLSDRAIGLVSTIILARLLVPEDFGVMAMAMSVFAFVEMGGQFGFDLALIRDSNATRSQYDSAWTLSVCYGVATALMLTALAWPAADFFKEARLIPVLLILGAVGLVQGFDNIGIVNFRKEFNFVRDFQLMFTKRLVAFVVTVMLAYYLRSFWALLAGIVTSRIVGTALSYMLHPYRPRWDLSQLRSLLRFSRWILLGSIIDFVIQRVPDFLIGRYLTAQVLGIFRVSREIATLPTSELIFPIMRAVFPGYAAVAHDRAELARSFLLVQGTVLMLSLPAGLSIILLAEPIVRVLLGAKWFAAIPLVQVLGLYGAISVFQATNMSIFNVLGVPKWGVLVRGTEALVLCGLLGLSAYTGSGAAGMAWAVLGALLVALPLGMLLIERLLQLGWRQRVAVTWRPLLGALSVAVTLMLLQQAWPNTDDTLAAVAYLALAVPSALVSFTTMVFLSWQLAGRPPGPEAQLLELLRTRSQQTLQDS